MYKSGALEATEHATGTLEELLRRYAKEAVPKISSYPGRVQSRLIKLCQYELTKIKVHKLTRQHFNAFRDERRAEVRIVKGKEKHISRKTIKDRSKPNEACT